jgi:glycosyltransferase involved in cell wall biosynthesis
MSTLSFLVPGPLETRTGGYIYDRRMIDELRGLGAVIDVHELDPSFPRPTPSALAHAARVLAALPDDAVVIVDGLACGAMPDEVAREAPRLRLVALVHHPLAAETGLTSDEVARFEASETQALAHARLVIVTSHRTASALQAYGVGPDRVAIVEPGTDRAPVARGSRGGAPHLLCVATLTPRKGHHTLFQALATLQDVPWRLTCVGSLDRDPHLVERLRTVLRDNQLEDRVRLAGETDHRGMAEHYDGADVFVLPTEYEGYGMAVAEALAHGLPVISTPTGGIPSIVTNGAGLLVAPGDVTALSDALRRVLSNPSFRAQLASAAVLVRDRLPSWKVAALRMTGALERLGAPKNTTAGAPSNNSGHERVQR